MTDAQMPKLRKDLTGRRFGRLMVRALHGRLGRMIAYHCECDCGSAKVVRAADLSNGHTQSCGCLIADVLPFVRFKHGGSGTSEHRIWKDMRRRCANPNNKRYSAYGGRGIAVCASWANFAVFIGDMGPRPTPKHTLDRIDNDGNYEPGNCRWATAEQQANNKSTSRFIEFNGQRMTVEQWNRALGWPASLLRKRLHRGWSIERALSAAPKQGNHA